MTFVSRLPKAISDPIFSVAEEARKAGPGALNASVGMILDEDGKPLVLDCVWKAADIVKRERKDFRYPQLLGLSSFRKNINDLVFKQEELIASAATVGGTGAVALQLSLLRMMGITRAILPAPSWANHRQLLDGFAFKVEEVPYLTDGIPAVDAVIAAAKASKEPTTLILQACCHNPTGKDLTEGQWRDIAETLAGTEHVVLLDCAYQGLGIGVEEDVMPVKILREAGVNLLLAWSASKNHTIYGLRTGLACAVVSGEEEKEELERHYMILLRRLHSAAPSPGQEIVSVVQERFAGDWRSALAVIRGSLSRRRNLLIEAFPEWKPHLEGHGLFTILPLKTAQILQLRKEQIFLTEDGRMNLGGIPLRRMEEFVSAVRKCRH